MKSRFSYLLILGLVIRFSMAHAGTVNGHLQGPSGLPIKNGVLSFTLEQAGMIAGAGLVAPLSASCYTSRDGSVVGMADPLQIPLASVNSGSGTLPGGVYYVEITFDAGSYETLPSPELRILLPESGTLTLSPPSAFPANATGMRVYIGTASGDETLQGETSGGSAQFSQTTPLTAGTAPPNSNDSICSIAFNDTIIPYSGYNVSLTSASGNAYPGWPQAWQLNGGLNGVVDLSSGAPLWNGTIIYPQPILAQPLNHGVQSISGPLDLSGYNLEDVGAIGFGTRTPSWPIDVENGAINASEGYLFNGAAPLNHVLLGDGSEYVDSATIPASDLSGLNLYYQTVQSNGTAQPQEPGLNFSPAFSLTDSSGSHSTVDLAPSGVTAGTYPNPTLTVDSYGRITNVSSPTTQADYYFSFTGCNITNGSNINSCPGTVQFTSGGNTTPSFAAMPDTNYYTNCTVNTGNQYTASFSLSGALTTSGFPYYWTEIMSNGSTSSTPTIYCHLHHS